MCVCVYIYIFIYIYTQLQACSHATSNECAARFVVGCSQHFGIVGNGQVAVAIEQGDSTAIQVRASARACFSQPLIQYSDQAVFPTNDAVFDCCWSEVHPEHVSFECCAV